MKKNLMSLYSYFGLLALLNLFFGVFMAEVSALEKKGASLCESDEKTFVSCETKNGKILSFCFKSSDDLSSPKELRYIFGKTKKVEMVYPEATYAAVQERDQIWEKDSDDSWPSTAQIRLGRVAYAGGGAMSIAFQKDSRYIYHYYSALVKTGPTSHQNQQYLDVYRDKKKLSHIRCKDDGKKL